MRGSLGRRVRGVRAQTCCAKCAVRKVRGRRALRARVLPGRGERCPGAPSADGCGEASKCTGKHTRPSARL